MKVWQILDKLAETDEFIIETFENSKTYSYDDYAINDTIPDEILNSGVISLSVDRNKLLIEADSKLTLDSRRKREIPLPQETDDYIEIWIEYNDFSDGFVIGIQKLENGMYRVTSQKARPEVLPEEAIKRYLSLAYRIELL